MLPSVVEVQERDVRAGSSGVAEELEEHPRLVRQVYRELEVSQGRQGRLQVSYGLQVPGYLLWRVLARVDLPEDDVGIYPPIIVDAVYVAPVTLDDLSGPVQCPGIIRHSGDERKGPHVPL